MSTYDNAPHLEGWANPPRPLRRCCGEDQGTSHCVRCGYLIPASLHVRPVEPIDDWPYSLMSPLGEN